MKTVLYLLIFYSILLTRPVYASEFVTDVTNRNVDAISSFLDSSFGGARLTLPFRERSKNGSLRLGAIHTGINNRTIQRNTTAFYNMASLKTCSPGTDLNDLVKSYDLVHIRYDFNKSGSINLEIKNIFTLLSLEASSIDGFELELKEVKIANKADNLLNADVAPMFDNDGYCRRHVFCGPKKTYVIDSVLEGKVTMKFIFKQSASLKLVDAVIEDIGFKIGINLSVSRGTTADGAKQQAVFSSGNSSVVFATSFTYWKNLIEGKVCSN